MYLQLRLAVFRGVGHFFEHQTKSGVCVVRLAYKPEIKNISAFDFEPQGRLEGQIRGTVCSVALEFVAFVHAIAKGALQKSFLTDFKAKVSLESISARMLKKRTRKRGLLKAKTD